MACQPAVMVVEITPQPPISIIRDVVQEAKTNVIPASTEFIPDFYKHEYEVPEKLVDIDEIWLEVDLSEQALYLHEGQRLAAGFSISSGEPGKDTPTGLYKIYAMYESYPMWGPDYHIPDVPFAMFYHVDFAIHGAYWQDNFGAPASHGCVNMNVNDAEWIYGNVRKGTYVYVH